MVLGSVGERTVRVILNGREQTRLRLAGVTKEVNLPMVELRPGVNRLDLVTSEPAVRVTERRLSLRAIGVFQLQLQIASEPLIELGEKADGPPDPVHPNPSPTGNDS